MSGDTESNVPDNHRGSENSVITGVDFIQYEDVSIEITLDALDEAVHSDAQKYFYLINEDTLLRWNKTTGEASALCPDPLCNHSTYECDFFTNNSIAQYSVANNTLYYTRNMKREIGFSHELWGYDMVTGKAQKLYEAYQKLPTIQAISSGCYFTDVSYSYESDNSGKEYYTVLYFVNRSGTVTKLATIKGFYNISSVRDGKLWWYENGGGNYVSDLYGKNFTAYNPADQRPTHENYAYFLRMTDWANGRATTALMRMNLDTREEEELLSSCAFYTIHGDRIYYLDFLKESTVIGTKPNSTTIYEDAFGGKLYSMDLNGEDKKLVIDDQDAYFFTLPAVRNSPLMDDRYMGIPLVYYEKTAKGLIMYMNYSMLILDTQTGEYKISVYEP